MKKRISSLLAIVLTIAILASTFVMLGMQSVSADETSAIEKVTVGNKSYAVMAEKNYTLYDSISLAVSGMTPTASDYANSKTVSFSNTPWLIERSAGWATDAESPKYIITDSASRYSQICYYVGNPKYGQSSISIYNNELYVDPSNAWIGSTETYYMNFNYVASEAGNIILYDTVGAVSSTGVNEDPFNCWLASTTTNWIAFEIYKNDELIWPLNSENNRITSASQSIEFPDLGKIPVVANDKITIKVSGQTNRAVVKFNPAVAYAYEPEYDTEVIIVGDNYYAINANEKYNLRDNLDNAVKGLDSSTVTQIDMSSSAWQLAMGGMWDATSYYTTFYYTKGYGADKIGNYTAIYSTNSIANWNTQHYAYSLSFVDDAIYINPWHSNGANYPAKVNLSFKAPRDGDILIYDLLGKIATPATQDMDGYYCWKSDNTSQVEITIWKNDEKIWPTNTDTDNIISAFGDYVDFSSLGIVGVNMDDVITVKVNDLNGGQRNTVVCDLEIAYIDPQPVIPQVDVEDNVVLGDKNYTVYSDKKYNAYDTFCGVVEGKTAAAYTTSADELSTINRLSFADTGWAASYTRGGTTYYTPVYINGQTNVGTSFNELYFPTGTSFIPYYNASIIYDQTAGMVINPGNSWAESKHFSLTYTASETGSIVLYDTDGKLTTPLKDELPYYCWTSSTAYVDVTVYKNDTVIWPLASEDNRLDKASDILEFPAIELNVSTGDVVTVTFATGSSVQRVPVVADLEVAYIHEHTSSVTETESTYYKDGIRDGLCYECGNTYENAPIYNAEAAATLDKSTLSYNPVTDVLSLTVKYGAGFVLDYYASEEYNPSVSMKYSIGGKTYNYSNYTFADDGVEFELSGINNTRLNTKMTIELSINWAGNTDGELYIDKASDTFATFSFFPCDVIATGETEAEQAAISAFNELTTTVTSAKSEDANVSAQLTTSDYFTVKQADLNVKDGTAIIWIKINDQFKKMIKDNTEAGYNEQGRKAVFTITIGGKEYTVEKSSINVGITVKISGLSYAQMFGEISVQMKVEYVDERATDIITDVVTHNFATAITDSDSLAAAALEAYMTAKSAVQS